MSLRGGVIGRPRRKFHGTAGQAGAKSGFVRRPGVCRDGRAGESVSLCKAEALLKRSSKIGAPFST
jgi:hypothetical protein